jgi:DNA-binding LytR/AlgR family response regulator
MRIALCDDENVHLIILREVIHKFPLWRSKKIDIEEFASGIDLARSVKGGNKYDFIFLDIALPTMSGLDVYADLTSEDTTIIFVSTHLEALPDVFAQHSHGFLPKPYNQDMFNRTVVSAMEQRAETQFFIYFQNSEEHTVPCKDILYFEVRDHYVYIHTIAYKECLHRYTIDEVENQIAGYGFFRCNRQYLVNLRHCAGREKNLIIFRQQYPENDITIAKRKLKDFDRKHFRYKMGERNDF